MDNWQENFFKTEDVLEKGKIISYLIKEKNYSVKEIAQKLRLTSSYICHLKRLNKLPDLIVDGYYGKLISVSHLFLISRLKKEEEMILVYEKILAENLNVSQTEELIREMIYQVKTKGKSYFKKENLAQLIKNYLRCQVKIIQTRIKGKIILEKKGSLDETTDFFKKIEKIFKKS